MQPIGVDKSCAGFLALTPPLEGVLSDLGLLSRDEGRVAALLIVDGFGGTDRLIRLESLLLLSSSMAVLCASKNFVEPKGSSCFSGDSL